MNRLKIVAGLALAAGCASMPALAQSGEGRVSSCTVVSLGAFTDRVHIQCNHNSPANSIGGLIQNAQPTIVAPPYFAVETGPMGAAALSAASAAMAKGRTLTIFYRLAASDNPGGCQANDCRRLTGVMVN